MRGLADIGVDRLAMDRIPGGLGDRLRAGEFQACAGDGFTDRPVGLARDAIEQRRLDEAGDDIADLYVNVITNPWVSFLLASIALTVSFLIPVGDMSLALLLSVFNQTLSSQFSA